MAKLRRALAAAIIFSCGFFHCAASATAASASQFVVDSWGIKNGLPQSSVVSLTQTHDGYLWLGTLAGLARFDGAQFTVFNEFNTPGLENSRVVYVFEDSRSNLWLGTETSGVTFIRDGVALNLPIGQGTRESRLVSACEDSSGAVWLYTADGQLCRYFDGQIDKTALGTNYFSNCRVVVAEKDGPIWVGTDHELFSLSPAKTNLPGQFPVTASGTEMAVEFLLAGKNGGCWRLVNGVVEFWRGNRREKNFGDFPWRADVSVGAACEDRDGNLVVGTLGDGVFWFDEQGGFVHIGRTNGMLSDWVLSLSADVAGNLWIGTDGGGLHRARRSAFSVVPETRDLVVQSVCEDGDGGLWIGLNNEGVIYKNGNETRRFGRNEGLLNLNVWSVFSDMHRQIWAGTWEGLHLFEPQLAHFLPVAAIGQRVLAIHQDRRGRLWFGTQNGLVCWDEREWKIYTTADGLSANSVRAIADDADGNIWIGTMGGGLNRLNNAGFVTFRKSADQLPSDEISTLYVDSEGALWIGTFGSGLARFHKGKWTRISTRDGLVSNGIGYIIEDADKFFWIGSVAGLMRVSRQSLDDFSAGATNAVSGRVYGTAEGLPTLECTQGSEPAACRTRDGRLWFPTIKGLASVVPANLKPDTNPPPVIVESVFAGTRALTTNALHTPPPKKVVVPPRTEQLEIHYTSLNLSAAEPARTQFRYKMAGHESAWVYAGEDRIAHYSKLPPGDYTFHVSARNEDGVWSSNGGQIALTVLPAFWQTGAFRFAVAIFGVLVVAAGVYIVSTQRWKRQVERMQQREALERDRARIARDLHDQLGASLTQVALLGEMVESDKEIPEEVEEYGRQISKTARETTRVLDEIVWAVNPQNDTLDGLVTYVCKNAQEYITVAGLRFRLEAPKELPATPIAPEVRHNVFLAVKESLTNIVRHAQATEVWMRLKLGEGGFTLEIQDNGRGIDLSKPSTRNGLKNMRKRMEDIGGKFSIEPLAQGGTLVTLKVSGPRA